MRLAEQIRVRRPSFKRRDQIELFDENISAYFAFHPKSSTSVNTKDTAKVLMFLQKLLVSVAWGKNMTRRWPELRGLIKSTTIFCGVDLLLVSCFNLE